MFFLHSATTLENAVYLFWKISTIFNNLEDQNILNAYQCNTERNVVTSGYACRVSFDLVVKLCAFMSKLYLDLFLD
jgi:hypothetical protein